ncbi:MAG: aminopeptidase P family protein, partial [Microcella sp.]|nr:aminopeptidase P family protein [Microcella sp.]
MADKTETSAIEATDAPRATENRSTTPASETFRTYISGGWADRPASGASERPQSRFAAARRAALSRLYPGVRLVIPAGPAKQRSNDTDYPYRAHSAFAHLTGWGSDTVAGSVLVLEPTGSGHEATLYFREAAGRDSDEFYANPEIGEFWTGRRPSLDEVAVDLGLPTAGLDGLEAVLAGLDGDAGLGGDSSVNGASLSAVETLVMREADRALTDRLDATRLLSSGADDIDTARDTELARDLSELRLVKDEFEIAELRRAVEATHRGFDDIIADLPAITAHPRGERLVEGTFNRRARAEGNTVGYDTIAASGPHACILHWTRNDGPVVAGDLVLIDAGVELDSYYTADITRTLPVAGVFTDVQRRVYEAVREAADAAFAVVRPGIRFREVHAAAMQVIAAKTAEWGFLPVTAEESLAPDAGYHRRYMVHGTSHHLGLDVHDCGQARREFYMDGVVAVGMVFTIEPGLYFQPDDLTVPAEYRGIGVRIEDNILVTVDG